jgi:hypothetical protein
MDSKMDLNVLAVGGTQWTVLEDQCEKNFSHENNLQHLVDVLGIPRIVSVERVKGIEPSS